MYIYLSLLTDDKTRCRLSTIPGVAGSDYINASYIDVSACNKSQLIRILQLENCTRAGNNSMACFLPPPQNYHKQRAFLATQGPLPDTTDDFWRMVWENNSATIVMLTQEREAGKIRCHKYWPESGADKYGIFQVIHHSTSEYTDYMLREFNLIDTMVCHTYRGHEGVWPGNEG